MNLVHIFLEETLLPAMPHILLQKIGKWLDIFPALVSITSLILFWQKYSQDVGQKEKSALLQCYFFQILKTLDFNLEYGRVKNTEA